MMKKKNFASGCAALLLMGYGATASSDFTGGYVGGSMGLFSTAIAEISTGIDESFGVEDMFTKFDLLAGFGMQQDRAYFGVEGQYTLVNNLDGTIASGPGGDVDIEANEGWALSARIGYVPQSSVLLYGKVSYGERNFGIEFPDMSDDEDFSGPGFGVGVEYLATETVSLRLEGMRYDYSSESNGLEVDPVEQTVDLAAVVRF